MISNRINENGLYIRKSVLNLIILSLIGCLLNIFINAIPLDLIDKLYISSVFVIFSYSYMFYTLISTYKTINFVIIFLFFSIPFSYGQHFIALINPNYLMSQTDFSILDGKLMDKSIISGTFFIIIFLLLLVAGYIASNTIYKNNDYSICNYTKNNNIEIVTIVALIFLTISIIPAFKIVISQYQLSRSMSYLVRRQMENDENYLTNLGVSLRDVYISGWFLPSIYLLLIAIKSKVNRYLIYLLLSSYSIVYLLSGSRFTILKIALNVFLIEFLWNKSFSIKDLKKFSMFILPIAMIFSTFSSLRGMTNFSLNDFVTHFSQYIKNAPISSIFWETGITFTTVSNAIDKVPNVLPYYVGKSYLFSLLICLPNFLRFGMLDGQILNISKQLSPLYYHSHYFGYGSSIYAEQYYNFGLFSFIIAFLFGISIGYFEKKLFESITKKNSMIFFIITYLFGEILYSVRNDLYAIPRTIIFGVLPIVITCFIFKSIFVNKLKM